MRNPLKNYYVACFDALSSKKTPMTGSCVVEVFKWKCVNIPELVKGIEESHELSNVLIKGFYKI